MLRVSYVYQAAHPQTCRDPNRVRTKLVAALRTAIFRLQEAKVDVERMLDLRGMWSRSSPADRLPEGHGEALVGAMDKALRRITNSPRGTTSRHSSIARLHFDMQAKQQHNNSELKEHKGVQGKSGWAQRGLLIVSPFGGCWKLPSDIAP